jgi:5'(3')-deoxyribonucleotidase
MIYVDMDGVLADLERGARERGITLCDQGKERHHMTPAEIAEDDKLRILMDEPGFFEHLPPMRDVMTLWHFVLPFNPVILTARPKSDAAAARTAGQKARWLKRELNWFKADRFVCCLRSEKANFIHHVQGMPQILIDDRLSNCVEWQNAGGYPILHTSADDTVRRARVLIEELAPMAMLA